MSTGLSSEPLEREGTTVDQSGATHSMPARPVRTIATFGLGKAIPGLITFASIPLWLAAYGAQNYALYSLYWITALVGTSMMTGWIRQAILRFTGSPGMQYEGVRRHTRWLLESSSLAAIFPVVVLATSMVEDGTERIVFLLAVAVGLLCQSKYAISLSLLQRDARSGGYAVAEVVRCVGTLGLSLLLVAAVGRTSWGIVAAGALATIAAMMVVSPRRALRGQVSHQAISHQILISYWRFGWPMSLWLTVSAGLIYLDRIVVMALFGPDRAGRYAAAADMVIRGMGLVVAPVIMFLHPSFMRAWNSEERQQALRRWKRATLGVTAGTLAAAAAALVGYVLLGDVLLGSPLTPMAFGLLALGGAAWQLALMAHKPLEASGRTLLMLGVLMVSVGVTVVLDLLLARPFAELGVVISSVAGAFFYVAAVLMLNVRSRRLDRPNTAVAAR